MTRIFRNAGLTIIAVTILSWMVWLYGSALRDPRFFDGWILAAAMTIQFLFHVRRKFPGSIFGDTATWMQVHIYVGYFVIAAFAFHAGTSLPDTLFEWTLWILFILVALSGAAGAYLSWSIPAKLEKYSDPIVFESVSGRRSVLAHEVNVLARNSASLAGLRAISDLYVDKLHAFFQRPQNLISHLRSSRQPLAELCAEIDNLERYLDGQSKQTLQAIKDRVVAKYNLDFLYTHHGLLKAWLFIHIPATYCLVVLTIFHVAVVYAHTSGVP